LNALVDALFHEVVDLPPAERTPYLDARGVDDDTRREVEALLGFAPDASAVLVREIGAAATRALPQLDVQGSRCGPYQLLKVIGRGGMGTVYLAERADGEVTQRVAVKLLPPGAADSNRDRFLQERQILATLDHPNIARLLDAGRLAHGQPFLAMEYVDGRPIDVFAAELPIRKKIGLFLEVCAAVAYLHRHLVVHRDLKPNNILVTADGEPKLLDFGIARLLDASADATATAMRMLTPSYASPEQITGGNVSTATDIYSLGALLYRLLTGRTTHDFAGCSNEAVVSIVARRDVTPPHVWSREVRGDLESILLKALRRHPQDRYATVDQFADDLQAFLDSRPVRARSGNRWYVARKFVRRYWIPVTAATMVIGSLGVGLYVANRERVIAQRRFDEVRQLSTRLFDIDNQVRQLSGSTKARQMIVDTSLEYLQRLTADVRGDPSLALEAATAYISVAQVEGVTTGPTLGQLDPADRHLRVAMELLEPVLKAQPASRTALLRAAQITSDRTWIAWQDGRAADAAALAAQSVGWMNRLAPALGDRAEAGLILNIYSNLAHKYMLAEQFDEALRLCDRGMELAALYERPADRGGFLMTVALARPGVGAAAADRHTRRHRADDQLRAGSPT
jgi:serine/threonine protein kinase